MTTFLNDDLAPADCDEQAEAMAHDALVYELSVVLMRLDGNDGDPHQLIWCGGPTPEPWGDAWQKYEEQADDVLNVIGEGLAQAMVTAFGERAALASQVVQEPVACALTVDDWMRQQGLDPTLDPTDRDYWIRAAFEAGRSAAPVAAGEPHPFWCHEQSHHRQRCAVQCAECADDDDGVAPSVDLGRIREMHQQARKDRAASAVTGVQQGLVTPDPAGVPAVPAAGPLRELGAYLANVLDEDQWARAEALLLKAAAGVEAVDSKTVPPSPAADPQKQPDSSYPAQPASQEVTAREAELTKLLWQAREALKTGEIRHVSDWEVTDVTPKIVRDAIAAINEALQEPTCAK